MFYGPDNFHDGRSAERRKFASMSIKRTVPPQMAEPTMLPPPPIYTRITCTAIMTEVSVVTGVAVNDLLSARRDSTTRFAKLCFYWIAARLTKHSWKHIGRACDKDHSTVLSGARRVDREWDMFAPTIAAVKARLGVKK